MTKSFFLFLLYLAIAVSALGAQEKKAAAPPAKSQTAAPAKKIDFASVKAPKPAADLKPGTWKYKTTVAMGTRNVEVSIVTEVKEDGNFWTANTTMEGFLGEIIDTTTLEKGTLVLRKLDHKQGRLSYHLDFTDSKASGTLDVDGQERPLSGVLTGPVFANGAGTAQIIACLPLAEGYSSYYRNFDVREQRERLMQLKVAGVEKVTVPAGVFEAYRVEITSADGGNVKESVWIAKDSRQPVKLSAVLAAMGSVMTQELEK